MRSKKGILADPTKFWLKQVFRSQKQILDKQMVNTNEYTFESPTNASKTASDAKVTAKGTMPPVINLAKQAISGLQRINSVAD